jgi:uncharacterized membrane protein
LYRKLLLALVFTAILAQSAPAQLFEVTNTIPIAGANGLPEGTWGWSITGVNASGLVVGSIETQTGPRTPYTWTAAGATALALPAGHIGGSANGVNAQGWVVGTSYSEFGRGTVTVWKDFASPIAIAVPNEIDSEGTAIGNGGHVAGITGLDRPGPVQGFVWNNETFTHLTIPGGSSSGQSIARSINTGGLAVGYGIGSDPSAVTATRWENGTPASLEVTGNSTTAKDVNDAGVVVGIADRRGFIIRDGEVEYLSHGNELGLHPNSVNAGGDVAGTLFFQDPNNRHEAFLYRDGEWYTGSELLGLPGIVQTEALEVTDDGRIFILGYDSQFRPTVYEIAQVEGPPTGENPPPGGGSPPSGVPEPTAALLLGIAGLGAAGWRRLRR